MKRCKIVFVGGGSNAWTPNIVKDLMLTPSLAGAQIVLYDINKQASDLNKRFLDKLKQALEVEMTIVSTNNASAAFGDADYVIITISTGGLAAMAYDLSIPERFGIYHTVGDTSGPGGWARSIRNFGAFVRLAEKINAYCPNAFILNYTNPMPFLTNVLQQLCRGPVIGLCHGLFENIEALKGIYKTEDEHQFHLKYGGLNHFFWIIQARYRDIDILADFHKKLKRQTLSDMLRRLLHADAMGFTSGRAVADELFRLTGVMPYFGDRHTCEYFAHYITHPATMKRYHLIRTTIRDRQKMFAQRQKSLHRWIAGVIPDMFFKRSRETAADIIDAHFSGKTFIDVGNVRNIGQISNLPLGTVVETACRIDKNGVTPLLVGNLPDVVAGFCQPYATVFDLTVKACFEKDKSLALQALRLDPLCSHLTWKQVKQLGLDLLHAHKKFIDIF